jgi:hypothetical protein
VAGGCPCSICCRCCCTACAWRACDSKANMQGSSAVSAGVLQQDVQQSHNSLDYRCMRCYSSRLTAAVHALPEQFLPQCSDWPKVMVARLCYVLCDLICICMCPGIHSQNNMAPTWRSRMAARQGCCVCELLHQHPRLVRAYIRWRLSCFSRGGRGDGTAAAYDATVLSFPHYRILSPHSGTLRTC